MYFLEITKKATNSYFFAGSSAPPPIARNTITGKMYCVEKPIGSLSVTADSRQCTENFNAPSNISE